MTDAGPEDVPVSEPPRNRRNRGEPKLFISYLPDGKGGPREDKGSVPLEVDVEAHIEERTDCEPGIYRIEKKRSGEFSGDVMFYTKEPLARVRSVGPSVASSLSEQVDAEADVGLDDDAEEELPADRLLRSLNGVNTEGGRVVVIAKRKADPVGMSFRLPCATDCTIGEVPYDDRDPSIDALELAIQKLYGGGRYEIVIRQDGETVGSVLRTIADPVASGRQREDGPMPSPQVVTPQSPAVPPRSPIEEVKASVSVFKDVASVLNNMRGPEPERETPLETIRNAVSLVKDLNTYVPHTNGGGEGDGGSTVRDWMDGIASIGREFGLGQALNNLIIFGLQEASRKRAVDAAAKVATVNAAQPELSPPSSDSAVPPATSAMPPVSDPHGRTAAPRVNDAASSTAQPPGGGGPSLEMLPPPMRLAFEATLDVLVAEMQRSETCDEHETGLAASALQEFMEKFPTGGPTVLDYFMQQSPTRLLLLLSTMRPEWSSLIDLHDGAGFIGALQDEWNEAKSGDDELFGKPEKSNGLHLEPPN